METTYDVTVWGIRKNKRAKGTYTVRWRVAGRARPRM